MVNNPLFLHLDPPPRRPPSAISNLLVELLAIPSSPSALNFYSEASSQADGDQPGEATQRVNWLTSYLISRWHAPIVLIGEAPGYQGARHSGIAFTSQFQLTGAGWKEPSASIVHGVLGDLDAESQVLLWNATTLHPRRAGLPNTNRKPTPDELAAAATVTEMICKNRSVVAVGRVAAELTSAPYVRHPAHGGATAFRIGLANFLTAHGIPTPPLATT